MTHGQAAGSGENGLNQDDLLKVCHDLRGLIGAIGTWVHLLGDERADEATRRRALAAMAKDARELQALIEEISGAPLTLAHKE